MKFCKKCHKSISERRGNPKYCTTCAKEVERERRKARYYEHRTLAGEDVRKCKWCGKEFTTNKTNIYCSVECRQASAKVRDREYKAARLAEHKERIAARRGKRNRESQIDSLAAAARAAGLSYGKYVAMKGAGMI